MGDRSPCADATLRAESITQFGPARKLDVSDSVGHQAHSDEVRRLYLDGREDEAAATIPDELVHDMHIIGAAGYVRERAAEWESTGVTTLLLSCRSADEVRRIAEVLVQALG